MNFKKIKEAGNLVLPVVITLLAAFFTELIPINVSFIPPDKAYGIGLTIYSVVWTGVFKLISQIIDYFASKKSFIKIEFAEGKPKFEDQKLVNCDFISDVNTVYFKIQLKGNPKSFLDKEIRILLPPEVEAHKIDINKENYSSKCDISNDKKSISIKVNNLYNIEKTKRIEDSKTLGFKVMKSYEEIDSFLETSIINNKKRKIKMITNQLFFTK